MQQYVDVFRHVPRMLSKFNMAAIKPEVIFAKLLTHSLTHSINQSINQPIDSGFSFVFFLFTTILWWTKILKNNTRWLANNNLEIP